MEVSSLVANTERHVHVANAACIDKLQYEQLKMPFEDDYCVPDSVWLEEC